MDLAQLRRLIEAHTEDMDRVTFWRLVEASRVVGPDSCHQQIRRLQRLLARQRPKAILQFERLWREAFHAAYSEDLWAAAYILNEGCSPDGFIDFRQWLIGQGEAVFRAAVQDPDTLANVVPSPPSEAFRRSFYMCEHLGRVAKAAYLQRTGEELPLYVTYPPPLYGESWEDADLPRRLPKLWVRFGWPLGEERPPIG